MTSREKSIKAAKAYWEDPMVLLGRTEEAKALLVLLLETIKNETRAELFKQWEVAQFAAERAIREDALREGAEAMIHSPGQTDAEARKTVNDFVKEKMDE